MEKVYSRKKISKLSGDRVFDSVNAVLLSIVVLITLYPFYLVLVLALNDGIDAIRGGIYFWPRKFTLDNFVQLINDPKWVNGFIISIARTLSGTMLGVFFTAMVAYGMSFKQLLFKKTYFSIIIFAMYFHGGLIPTYVLFRSLGLLNNFLVYIIPSMFNIFFMLVMVTFFRDIPDSLFDASRIDGANEFIIFFRIVLPISLPIIATVSLFVGVGQWNSWLDSAYYVQKKSLWSMSYLMMEIINRSMIDKMSLAGGQEASAQQLAASSSAVTTRSLQMAAMIVAVTPILCVYPFLQKYFVKGIMLGSIKE